MPGPGLIRDYLAALAGQLPAPLVTELADGLDQTRRATSAEDSTRMPPLRRRSRDSASPGTSWPPS
jgi:hypothetical protein